MTLEELDQMIADRETFIKKHDLPELGIGMQIVLPAPGSWRWPERIRTPFGLCRYFPASSETKVIACVSLKQMRRTSVKLHRSLTERNDI